MRRVHFEAVGLASALLIILALSAFAQHHAATPQPSLKHAHGTSGAAGQWEGSPAGKAYSEFNHRLAGVFVLLIGLSELRGAMGVMLLAWTRFLLPAAMLGAGGHLMIWSDHDAWPIGSLSFTKTVFSDDYETIQHKLYAILLLVVGASELLKRMGRTRHTVWGVPLRSEEHTSELQSPCNLVCRLLLEKKKKKVLSQSTLLTARTKRT